MRLARSLIKALIVLAVAAGALGGAAALGSTLFEKPPRDAEAFAQRVEASSERAVDEKHTRAERRFARRLTALCLRQRPVEDELGVPASVAELPAWYRRARPVALRHRAQVAALETPRSYRDEMRELLTLDRRSVALLDRLVERLAAGDRAAFEEMRLGLDRIKAQGDELLAQVGGVGCIRD